MSEMEKNQEPITVEFERVRVAEAEHFRWLKEYAKLVKQEIEKED